MILLTGSSGFLGKYIEAHFIESNITYKALNRSNGDYSVNLATNIPEFDINFDTVIHSSGLAHFAPRSIEQIDLFYEVNVVGTQNLLKGLEKCGDLKYFVYISSVSVYGLEEGRLIKEETPLLAKDPYGISKIKAEEVIQNWCNSRGIKFTILRLPLIFGSNPKGNLESMIIAIKKGYYFNLKDTEKSIVLAEDVADIILPASLIGGIFNLTDGVNPNICNLSKKIAMNLGKNRIPTAPTSLVRLIAHIGDYLWESFPINTKVVNKLTKSLTFDDMKARKLLNWNPKPVLENI